MPMKGEAWNFVYMFYIYTLSILVFLKFTHNSTNFDKYLSRVNGGSKAKWSM